MVNFPVANSVFSGSTNGSKLSKSSRCRICSCCSYNATARGTSNFRANKNFIAVDALTVFRPVGVPTPFTRSVNCFTA